jgi:hypothetical protein
VVDKENELITIFYLSDNYRYQVIGNSQGTYGLKVKSGKNNDSDIFTASNIPTSPHEIHQYSIDWNTLSQGKDGVVVQADSNGDGVFERTITTDSDLTKDEYILQTATTVDLKPDTLNLKRNEKWVTVYIGLPQGHSVNQIDSASLFVWDTIHAIQEPTMIGDYDSDGVPHLKVKFD